MRLSLTHQYKIEIRSELNHEFPLEIASEGDAWSVDCRVAGSQQIRRSKSFGWHTYERFVSARARKLWVIRDVLVKE